MGKKIIVLLSVIFFPIQFNILCKSPTGNEIVNSIKSKERQLQLFLNDAVSYLEKHSLSDSCSQFAKNLDWRRNDMFITIFEDNGLCRVFGNSQSLVGYDFSEIIDVSGLSAIQVFKRFGKGYSIAGLETPIQNAILYTCFAQIKKDNKNLIIASAFYAYDTDIITYGLIRKALELFNIIGIQKTISIINDPFSTLRQGDIYLAVLKNANQLIAHGNEAVRIGQNVFDLRTTYLTIIRSEYEKFMRNQKEDFIVRKIPGKFDVNLFIQKYTDPKTKTVYTIGAASYPHIDDDDIINLVNRAAEYIKNNKKEYAFNEFTTNKTREFKVGESMISVYDKNGLCLANGEDPSLVGFNRSDIPDEYGQLPIKDAISQALKYDKTWVTIFDKNAYKTYYAKRIDLPFETFIVASGYWPMSKAKITEYIVKRGLQILNRFSKAESFEKFCDGSANFLRGDIKLVVIDEQGNTLVDGHQGKYLIWTRFEQQDAFRKNIYKKALEIAKSKGGWIEEKQKTTTFKAFVQPYTKNNKTLILYAGYYD